MFFSDDYFKQPSSNKNTCNYWIRFERPFQHFIGYVGCDADEPQCESLLLFDSHRVLKVSSAKHRYMEL